MFINVRKFDCSLVLLYVAKICNVLLANWRKRYSHRPYSIIVNYRYIFTNNRRFVNCLRISFQLHAEYDRNKDVYLSHRVVQAYHLSKVIGQITDPEDFVLLCGDMNSEPEDPCYRILKELPQFNDCWLERGSKVGCLSCIIAR